MAWDLAFHCLLSDKATVHIPLSLLLLSFSLWPKSWLFVSVNLKCSLQKIKTTFCFSRIVIIYKAPNLYLEMQAYVDSSQSGTAEI